LIDIYTDYLISSTLSTSCVGLSRILNDGVSHDRYTRMLSKHSYGSKELWERVKNSVSSHSCESGILIFDDTISHKPYSKENELVNWHYDHSKGYCVKGIGLLTGLYVGKHDVSLPVVYELISKNIDKETGKIVNKMSKNAQMRNSFDQVIANGLAFKYVLADVWYGSSENMTHIKSKGKEFIMPLKHNRLVALSEEDKQARNWVAINSLKLEPGDTVKVYLKETPYPVTLVKEELVNQDLSTASLYLVSSDEKLSFQQIISLYQKRWKVEEYHKSLKNNASLQASPTKTTKTQANHIFMSLIAYCKLELLKIKNGLNHFAFKALLYTKAMATVMNQLRYNHQFFNLA
jgi:Transposase DDE domain